MSHTLPNLINSEQFKHLLTPAIYDLSHKIQNSSFEPQNAGSKRYLNIENEALEHIGSLILNVFNSILLANYNITPEATCSVAMSSNLAESPSVSSVNTMVSETNSFPDKSVKVDPILDLTEAELRVRRAMPIVYIDPACEKAIQMVEKCRGFMNNSKRNKLLKAINDLHNNLLSTSSNFTSHISSSIHVSSNNSELAQHFKFPIDRIHAILSKEIFFYKLDLFVTIYLVYILEFICKDILRLATYYVRILGKYNITKSDVTTAIQADHMLTKVFCSDNFSSDVNYLGGEPEYTPSVRFEFNNLDDDAEDEIMFAGSTYFTTESEKTKAFEAKNLNNQEYDNNEETFVNEEAFTNSENKQFKNSDNTEEANMNTKLNYLKTQTSTANGSSSSNNEEVTSDSSTICAESISLEQLNQKYNLKVKELIQEQNQYLNDLNILRRIFMYLFKKCCYLFSIKLNEPGTEIDGSSPEQQMNDQIENIFGNINDLYDCALRLADLLDDVRTNNSSSISSSTSDLINAPNSQPSAQLMVGQQFWELAEGDEFSIYTKYAECVTNFAHVKSCITCILNNPNAHRLLQQTSPGLAEISKYLLPKLLMSSIYHLLYVIETVEYLQQCATDEDDKILLSDTLDTLKATKFKLEKLGFTHSRCRPIETSFRMFQAHQFLQHSDKLTTNSSINAVATMNGLSNSVVSGLNNLSQKNGSICNMCSSQALVSNITALTQRKMNELETKVDSFKLPSNINQPIVQVSLSKPIDIKNEDSNKLRDTVQSESSVRNPYLYEGSLSICRTSQPIQNGSTKISSYLGSSQSRHKVSKRYAYLFDGFLILVKKVPSNYLTNNNKFIARFKQAISLDKCYLKDHDNDETSFEIQIFNNNSVSSSTFAFYAQQQNVNSSSKSNSSLNNYQDQEFIIFMCDSSKDKWNWMSMLCYAQYKFTVDRLLQQMTEEQNREYTLPIPPDNYIFDWPDSPETIIFDQQSNSGVNPYLSSENLLIRAATLIKLVERLTHHQYLYPKFSHTFLMCYREFCTSHELFNLLSQRYDVPDLSLKQVELEKYTSGGIIERELFKRYKREYQQPIRLKVINVIKHWIYGYFYDDFANDSDLLQKLHDFILKVGLSNQRYKQVLLNILNKKLSQRQKINVLNDSDISRLESLSLNSDASINSDKVSNKVHTLTSSLTNSGFPIKTTSSRTSSSSTIDDGVGSFSTSSRLTTPNDSIDRAGDFFYDDMPAFETHLENSFPYDILTIHPLEFARQATLMESELFKAIKPSELISLGWNKPDQRYKLSPNLTKLINLSNKFTYWYAKCIVDTLNIEERVAVVLRILDIAEYFYEMNNFSGLKEIYASLETSSVIRLETTREKSSVEQHKMYAIFKQLFENHDRGYLERIKKCNPPCVPFIGSHLSIILKTQEYNKLNDENHKRKIIMQQQQLKKEEALSNEDGSESSAPANFSILAKTHLINFSKYRILVEFVNDLLQYQNMSYKYRVHEKIHSFILEDIENYFKAAQNALESKEDEFESKLNFTDTNSCSSEVINMSRPDPSQMVEAWLFARSKQIEPKEVFHYPRIKNYPLKAPPMTDKSTSKISKSSTFSQPNLSKTDSNKSINKLARNDKLKNSASMHNSKLSSSGNCNDVIDKFAGSQSLTSRNIFQKRSNSSIQQLKLPDRINMSSTSPSPSPSPSPTHSKYSGKFSQTATTNILNKLLSSSSQMSLSSSNNNSTAGIPNSSTAFTLASSSSSAMSSSQMFPSSTNISSSIAPFGSFYSPSANTVANTFFAASSPQPSQSSNQNISSVLQNNISGSSTNITDQSRTSGSSSSVNGALSSVCYAIGHGHEKLSLSSADSSSSAPNSPPPNYDEVFDSSSIANTFNFTGYNNLPNNQANSYLIPNNVNNCYDNKTYFQRMDSNFDESQQNIQIHKTLNDVSTMKSCKNQPSVFSFPDLSEQNEEIKMSSRANSTDFLSSSSSIQSSPLLPQEDLYMNKKTVQHAFNMLEPPPLRPPPPPPTEPPAIPALPSNMQLKSSVHSMRNSSSQLSLNLNAPPPPVYPPPPPILNNEDQIGILRQPPPIPARPGKNSQLNQ